MKKAILLLGLWGTALTAAAQSSRADSLRAELKAHSQADTFRVNRLNDLTGQLGLPSHEYDSLNLEALQLARRLGYLEGQALALSNLGSKLYYLTRNEPTRLSEKKRALQWLDDALRVAEKSGNKRLLIELLTGIGAAKRVSNGEKKQALTHAQRALTLAQSLHDPALISNAECMIGYYYDWVEGNYAAALHWNLRALRTARQARCVRCEQFPLRSVAENYTALREYPKALRYLREGLRTGRGIAGVTGLTFQYYVLTSMGSLFQKMGRYPEGVAAYHEAFRVRKAQYPAATLALFDRQLSGLYELQGRYSLAVFHAQRGLAQSRRDHNAWGETVTANTLSRAYRHLGQPDSAQVYGLQSFTIARQTARKEYVRDASQTLADLYAQRGNYPEAYRYQGLYFAYRDSLNNEEVTRKATAAQFTFQISQQQNQIQLQAQTARQQRFQRNVLIVGGLLLLLLGAAVSAWLLNRARLRRLEDAQTLRNRLAADLHDEIGSTLSSISMLSGLTDTRLGEHQPEAARTLVQKIQTDARQTLDSMDEIIWTIHPGNDSLQRTALRLQEYAQPLMESKGIQFHVHLDPNLPDEAVPMDTRRAVYLIGKETINNLVKHSEATEAALRFEQQKEQFTMTIEDNGRGFDPTAGSSRNGQKTMRQRAVAVGGTLAVESAPGQGTRLRLAVPLG